MSCANHIRSPLCGFGERLAFFERPVMTFAFSRQFIDARLPMGREFILLPFPFVQRQSVVFRLLRIDRWL